MIYTFRCLYTLFVSFLCAPGRTTVVLALLEIDADEAAEGPRS